ncbi:acyltransferase [Ruania alkalisoli]|uniref:Acyltransferase n=1 Tax=Ruania alkalisoli TaxID=2779775 RepID=A0A7M1SQR8_9MICO|nr:acyltransferase [Ruania alkalisoli]QOR69900.1 acyltransferase [Ruania alkalisoli]
MSDHTTGLIDAEPDFNTWAFWSTASAEQQQAQRARLHALADGGAHLGENCVVSEWAACYADSLTLGDRSYLAAFSYVTGDIEIGANSTVNAYAVVRGTIRIGDGVRIGAHTALLGFDHTFAPERPVHEQPVTSAGITIGNDVYIGSHVSVVDGVTIGAHSVIGAGSVVTKDVPEWSIVVGNPARRIRDRRDSRDSDGWSSPSRALAQLAERAREEASALLARCWDETTRTFSDTPGADPTVRALCDAVELADLLGLGVPEQLEREEIVETLTRSQDPATGLIPQLRSTIAQAAMEPTAADLGGGPIRYHLLCAGYALDLLGARFTHPIRVVDELRGDAMIAAVEQQPWSERAWGAGDWVDSVGTALLWNRDWFGRTGPLETLIGWLHLNVDRHSGMWGSPRPSDGLRQPVNGFYRLTRGTFAQFGLPLPQPERAIDTVLAHARDDRRFAPARATACDVLDIAHPLWLAGHQTNHRRSEVRAWAAAQVPRLAEAWHPGAGFGFAQRADARGDATPSLQGTEMWLAIAWYLADLLGESGALRYEPRGVHRPWAR